MNPEVNFDTLSLLNSATQQRYQNPAVTIKCGHIRACFEMQDALQKINQQGSYQCPHCQSKAISRNDLVEDWRAKANQEFNEFVDEVTMIKNIMFNKYNRSKKKYLDFFLNNTYLDLFTEMFSRFTNDSSINSIILKDLQQQNQGNQNKINFWSFCLQDRVKINIPVRIIGCKHYECYELTSLLFYQEQNRQKKQFLECNQPGCSNRLQIAQKDYNKLNQTQNAEQDQQNKILDIQTLFSQICVDLDLFNAIKKSNPSSYKFYFNRNTKQIQEDINIENGKHIDQFIKKFYNQKEDLKLQISQEEFQKQIQILMIPVIQGTLLQDNQQLQKQIALYKYRNYKVKMQDQFTKLPIEYPVRCKSCKNLEVCMDMRSYIADFFYNKRMNPNKSYNCPICKQELTKKILMANIQNYIYLDSNMLSYMFKDMSYTNGTQIFEYQGEQYMLQEFMDKQKLKRETYIESLQENKQVKFSKLFCLLNQDLKLKYPLILQDCPQKNIIDFKSFYEELKKINFDYETNQLILCKCTSCNQQPIKSFIGKIYFHEAFYEALTKFYQNKDCQNDTEFAYIFGDKEQESMLVGKTVPTNNSKIRVVKPLDGKEDAKNLEFLKGENGFLDLMNDEEYQQLFGKTEISGFSYQAQQMKQNIGGIEITYTNKGISADCKSGVERFNQNANQVLKQYQFQVIGMGVELHSDLVKQSKGTFKYEKP